MGNSSTLIMIALMVVAFYLLIMRPQKKRQQAIQRTLDALGPGSRVLLGSGLFGTIVSVGDRQAVLEISPGVQLTVLKQAIVRTVTEADEDSPVDEADEEDLDDELVAEPEASAAPETTTVRDEAVPGTDRPSPSAGADPKRLS